MAWVVSELNYDVRAGTPLHMGGRVYDPTIGRFLSADLLIQEPNNTQSYNRYSYVMNNPTGFVDPSGYCRQGYGVGDNWGMDHAMDNYDRMHQADIIDAMNNTYGVGISDAVWELTQYLKKEIHKAQAQQNAPSATVEDVGEEVDGQPKNASHPSNHATLTLDGNKVTITANAFFEGSKELVDKHANTIIKGIESVWSPVHKIGKYSVETKINRVESRKEASFIINLYSEPNTSLNSWRSHVSWAGAGDMNLNVEDSRLQYVAAHEFGHVLGFGDAYDERSQLPYTGYSGTIMADPFGEVAYRDIVWLLDNRPKISSGLNYKCFSPSGCN